MFDKTNLYEVIPDRLYFSSVSRIFLPNSSHTIYVTADESDYPEIQSYFGPPCISDICKYCTAMEYLIRNTEKKVIHWSSYMNLEKFTNAIFLICSFMLLVYNRSSEHVTFMAREIGKKHLLPFRDTTNMRSEPTLDIKYFFAALYNATKINWFNIDSFNVDEYDTLASVGGGDMNWIVPGKLLALSNPFLFGQSEYLYIRYFKRNNIVALVQLNGHSYDRNIFRRRGIQHYDLHFADGSVPNLAIIKRFLALVECTDGAIAVHCRAGLGRTGTLIGAYIIKTYQISALETTAWLRLCRPGSVIGLQQRFLHVNEYWLKNYATDCRDHIVDDLGRTW